LLQAPPISSSLTFCHPKMFLVVSIMKLSIMQTSFESNNLIALKCRKFKWHDKALTCTKGFSWKCHDMLCLYVNLNIGLMSEKCDKLISNSYFHRVSTNIWSHIYPSVWVNKRLQPYWWAFKPQYRSGRGSLLQGPPSCGHSHWNHRQHWFCTIRGRSGTHIPNQWGKATFSLGILFHFVIV
jgi:hypothetical protein